MSVPMRILDLGGQTLHVEPGHTTPIQLPDGLNGQAIVVTDYGCAPFGVDILPISTRHIAPVVEKRLRDQGDIDGLAQVIIHDDERQGEIVRVFYTAIPVADFMRYRGWVDRHSDHVLVFPLAEALLATAHAQALDNGVLTFVHGDTVEVLVIHERAAVASARLRLFGTEPAEYQRVANTVAQLWREHVATSQGGTCILIEDQPGVANPLAGALSAQETLLCDRPLNAQALFDSLKRSQADLSPVSNLLHACSVAVPPIALLMMILCLLASGLWLSWRADTQALQADIARAGASSQSRLRENLTEALLHARGLEQSQRDLADFVRLFEQVRKTPDPASLIHHLRLAAPANIAVTEAGIIADGDEGILIVVSARSNTVAAPFDAERRFVNKLEDLGYQVVRREIEGGVDSSVFRLALTWSES